jgi:hypothetical protein
VIYRVKQELGGLFLAGLLCIVSVGLATCSRASESQLLFVRYIDLPGWRPVHMMYTMRISQLDATTQTLKDVWSLPDGEKAAEYKLYTRQKLLVVKTITGAYNDDEIFIVSLDSLKTIFRINVGAAGLLSNWPLLTRSQDEVFLRIEIFRYDRTRQFLVVDLRTGDTLTTDTLMPVGVEPVLHAGHYRNGHDTDVEVYDLEPGGKFWSRENVHFLQAPPLPESLYAGKDSSRWMCFLRQPELMLFGSMPSLRSDTTCNVLVLDLRQGCWKSLNVPGATSTFRRFRDWVGGEVNHDQATLTDSAFVMKPTEGRVVVDSLGEQSVILWAEGDSIWYRCKQDVYKARIGLTGFDKREKIFRDSAGSSIDRAFRLSD